MNTRVLIAGWPKSGTTALLYKIMGGLENPHWLFEPKGPLSVPLPEDRPVVGKLLFGGDVGIEDYATYEPAFPLRIWISRDPRDVMVSKFLWHISSGALGNDLTDRAVDWLRAKQSDPRRFGVAEIFEHPDFAHANAHVSAIVSRASSSLRLLERHNIFQFRYEDMIDGNWNALEDYLGFKVARDRDPGWRHKNVARSKGYGGWRRWFTPQDVELYRQHLDPVLRSFGYPEDWMLSDADLTDEDPVGYVTARLRSE